MPKYSVGQLGGRFVVNVYDDRGRRINRYRLKSKDKSGAEREAPGVFAELTRPQGTAVQELWNGFVADRKGRAVIATMTHTWKALRERFGAMPADMISIEDCRAHARARTAAGIKPGTIATELGHLRMVLRWAEKHRYIDRAPPIERPPAPKRKERHLTRAECAALVAGAKMPHVKLYVVLALTTGARNAALLDLTWDRCDFARGQVDLRDPSITRPHKGRAVVAMNRMLRAALLEARAGALSDHVIEWAGAKVGSVKKGLKAAARMAGLAGVSPHVLRHSAAVHMAEAGISMEVIAQYLGHEDANVTRRVYARFSPTYLRQAAAVLEYDDLGSLNPNDARAEPAIIVENVNEIGAQTVVGAAWIEHATPTMSTKRRAGNTRN